MLLPFLKPSLLSSIGAFLILSSLSSALAQEKVGKKYAVLAGVERYQHNNLDQLDYAVDDVTDLAAILKQSGYEVTLLTDDTGKFSKELMPTRKNIESKIQTTLRQCTKNDTFMLAFAGHGLQFTGQKDAYFCPVDARPFADETQTLVSISKVYAELEKSFAGVKVILIDACRNDPDPGRGRGGLDADAAPRPPRGVGTLFSCSAGQRAFEHDELKHGIFFHYVLEGLKKEARDDQGEVTFDGLALYVRKNVPRRVRKLFPDQKYDQFPNLKADLVGVPPVLIPRGLTLRPDLLTAPFNKRSAETKQREWAKYLGKEVDSINSIGMKFSLIPAGEFKMGSGQSTAALAKLFHPEAKSKNDEHPQHRVRITKPYYMGQHEVTVGQFRNFVNMTGYETGAERDGKGGWGWNATKEVFTGVDPKYNWKETGWPRNDLHPVINVSWNDAMKFCEWLSRQEGKKYRLPTEAEWEYACRAGTTSIFYHGNDPEDLVQIGNTRDGTAKEFFRKNYPDIIGISARDGFAFTSPVGSFRANQFGLFDMHGNATEWCQNWYDENYYKTFVGKLSLDPQGPRSASDSTRVLRGGSWAKEPQFTRSADRNTKAQTYRGDYIGFRVVCEIN